MVDTPRIWSVAFAGRQVAVDRRGRHREQLGPHRHAVPADAVDGLAGPFKAVQLLRIDAARYLPGGWMTIRTTVDPPGLGLRQALGGWALGRRGAAGFEWRFL